MISEAVRVKIVPNERRSSIMKADKRQLNFLQWFRGDKRGAIIVLFALTLPILVGAVGLGVEVTLWFNTKRSLQTAVDAAAIGGAYSLNDDNGTAAVTSDATTEATSNGYDASTDSISVNLPPTSGSYTADTTAVEVSMTRSVNLLFSGLFLDNAVSISARAVANAPVSSTDEACVLALDTTGAAVSVGGSGDVTFSNCDVASNSSDSGALTVSGAGDLNVDCYSVVGDVNVGAGLTTDGGCSGTTGGSAIDDPYSTLADPDDGGCDSNGLTHNANTVVTIGNGSYVDPYVVCGDVWGKKGTIILDGLVVIKGDIKANANGTITSDAVNGTTIVLKDGGQINNFNGSATVDLTAPDTDVGAGDWEGILFYQDRDTSAACTGNNCNTLNGGATSYFEGVVYFPEQELSMLGGNSAASTCLQIVALRVSFSGNSEVLADNDCASAGVDAISYGGTGVVALVE
jgi:Flp pilus assembly protein TadG